MRVRSVICAATVLLTAMILATEKYTFPTSGGMHAFAYLAFLCLYLTFLIGSLRAVFPALPGREILREARPALGAAAFLFALLHAYDAFFRFIGGFHGLQYWTYAFRWSLLWGFLALVILGLLTLASAPVIRRQLGRFWAPLQKCAYAAGLLVLVHGVTVTVHVFPLWLIFAVSYPFLVLLLVLETVRLDRFLAGTYPHMPHHLGKIAVLPVLLALLTWSFFFLNHHTN
jgi:DMSO/TMAO reductase YedYZ heme-binding membrane subunit